MQCTIFRVCTLPIALASLVVAAPALSQEPRLPAGNNDDASLVGPNVYNYTGVPGADGEEAEVRSAMVHLRKGQAEDVSETEVGRRLSALMRAERAYRAAVSRTIFNRMLKAGRDKALAVGALAYEEAVKERERVDNDSGLRLQTYLAKTPGTFEKLLGLADDDVGTAAKARVEIGLRLARIVESATHEVLTSFSPVVCPSVDFTEIHPDPVTSKFNGRCTSRTVFRLAQLSERIATSFPHGYIRSKSERGADVQDEHARTMAKIRNKLDMAEYRRVALTGLVVDPVTGVPIGGMLRIRIAENAERSLTQYLDRIGRKEDYTKLWSGEPLRDLAKSLVEDVKKRPDYKILNYLESGEEPTPKQLFRILAMVIRAEQDALVSAYNDGYLGGSFDKVDLEQLMRASNVHGAGDDNIDDVKERLEQFIKDMDAAHDAVVNAAEMTPQDLERLKPRSYQLMRQMGYIDTKNDDATTARYVIPETQHSFRAFAERASAAVYIPGKGMLSVVNLRNAGQAALSVVLPELAAARFASYGRNVFLSERAYATATFAGEGMAGTLLDVVFEYHSNLQNTKPGEKVKGVEWDRVILESAILGSALQFAGGAVDEGFTAAMRTLGSELPNSALYKAIAKYPRLAKKTQAYALAALGLATDTSMTTFFQMYVQGNMDDTAWKTVLMNAALSRAVAKDLRRVADAQANWGQVRKVIPEAVRPIFDANPKLRAEVMDNINKQLTEARNTHTDFQERTAGETISGKRLFRELATGQLNWRDLTRVIYPAMKDRLGGAMESLRVMREKYFNRMKREAIKRSIVDVNRIFDQLIIKANNETSNAAEFKVKLDALNARRKAELELVRKRIIAPGSKDVASDIDRSSQSIWVRRHLRQIYKAEARFADENGDVPTSARAFDVNEYMNVLPFIAESSKYMAEMRRFDAAESPGFLRHSVAMEALSLAAAMRFMDASLRLTFLDNKRAELKARINAGKAAAVDVGRLERQIEFAMQSIAKAEVAFDTERRTVADRNPGLSDSEIDLLATDVIYDQKMAEINRKQIELGWIENQDSDQALALRAEILRYMADGLRSGIETYSSPVGIDIIVSRVQGAKRPDGSTKKARDRLEEPGFTLEGDLHEFSSHDIEAMINDQLMFTTEHVHGFNSGHEGFYETGRALGKYVERAFLGMKILGLDIAEVRRRPESDPHRRLLEVAQALAAVKDDPQALLEKLRGFSRTSPKSHEGGMAEIFWLIEKVLPGMNGVTGVIAETPLIPADSPAKMRQLDATYRRIRMVARMRWRDELTLVRETLGPDGAVKLVEAELSMTRAELQWIDKKLAEMAKLGQQYQASNWKKVLRLQHAVREARVQAANLPDPMNPLLAKIVAGGESARQQLDSLRRPFPYDELVEANLYSAPDYRRMANRRDYLRDRLQWLKNDLKGEKKGAATAQQLMHIDLAGAWACDAPSVPGITATVSILDDHWSMELKLPAPLNANARLDAERNWGTIEGSWQANRGDEPFAAGFAEARPTEDGKEIWFTTGSTSDPGLLLDWSSLICRRDERGSSTDSGESAIRVSYSPSAGKPDKARWMVKKNDAGATVGRARIRRGRKVFEALDLEPGQYLVALSLGGRTVTRPIEMKQGMVAEIELLTASVQLVGVPERDRFQVQARLHVAGERMDTLVEFAPGDTVTVVPGLYDLELVTFLGSAWVTRIYLEPGQSLDIKTRTGTLVLPDWDACKNVAVRQASAPGGRERFWSHAGGQFSARTAGKYDIRWEKNGRSIVRQVVIRPGEETTVDNTC